MRSKKVLFLSPHFPLPANSGSPIATINTVKIFNSLNMQVDILSLSNTQVKEEHLTHGYAYFTNIFIIVHSKNVIISSLKALLSAKSAVYSRFYSPKFKEKLKDVAKGYDYIYSHHNYMAQYLKQLPGKSIKLNDIHVLEYNFFKTREETEKNIFKKLFCKLEYKRLLDADKASMQLADYNFTYSEKEHKQLSNANDLNIFLRPLTISQPPADVNIKPLAKNKTLTLFFFGDHAWFPNYDASKFIITELSSVIYEAAGNVAIKIAGRNIPAELKAKAANKKNITIIGELNDIYAEIAACDVILAPVRIGGGVRLKMLEALCLGKPVITNSIGAEGILDKTVMFVCDALTDYVATLKNILDNPEILDVYSKKALLYFNTFHSPEAGKKYFQTHLSLP